MMCSPAKMSAFSAYSMSLSRMLWFGRRANEYPPTDRKSFGQQACVFLQLPTELLLQTLEYLDAAGLLIVARTCHQLRQLAAKQRYKITPSKMSIGVCTRGYYERTNAMNGWKSSYSALRILECLSAVGASHLILGSGSPRKSCQSQILLSASVVLEHEGSVSVNTSMFATGIWNILEEAPGGYSSAAHGRHTVIHVGRSFLNIILTF